MWSAACRWSAFQSPADCSWSGNISGSADCVCRSAASDSLAGRDSDNERELTEVHCSSQKVLEPMVQTIEHELHCVQTVFSNEVKQSTCSNVRENICSGSSVQNKRMKYSHKLRTVAHCCISVVCKYVSILIVEKSLCRVEMIRDCEIVIHELISRSLPSHSAHNPTIDKDSCPFG